jgi:O-antigen/teichoic acid export membrane protein
MDKSSQLPTTKGMCVAETVDENGEIFSVSIEKKDFTKKSLRRDVGFLVGGTAASQVLLFLSSPFLTRLYTPSQIGALAIYVSILSSLLTVCALCYDRAIPLAEDENTLAHLLALCFLSLFLLAAVSFVTILGLRWGFAPGAAISWLHAYFLLLPLSLIGGGIYQIISNVAIRQQEFPQLARTRIIQSTGQISVQLGAGFLSMGMWGLVAGDVVGRAAGGFSLLVKEVHRHRNLQTMLSWYDLRRVAYQYRRFPQFSIGSVLLNNLWVFLPPLLLAMLYSTQVVGWYSLGLRVIGIPSLLIGNAASQVFWGEAARLKQHNPQALPVFFVKTLRRLLVVGITPILIIGLCSPTVFPLIFGAGWRMAGSYTQILTPLLLMQFLAGPLGSTLDVVERQDLHLYRETVRTTLLLMAFGVAKVWRFGPTTMIVLLSAAGTLGYVIYLFMSWHALKLESTHAKSAS